jgi:hypothetical protein
VNAKNIFTELKRRNVYRAAVAYGVVAWFLTQLTTQVFPFFEIPNSASQRTAAKDGELDCHYETEFYQQRCSLGLGTRK